MGMQIDGIAASEHIDSSGEILKVEGHDISDLVEGRGVLNFEHDEDKSAENILGAITYAKKIFKAEDCTNDRERSYWDACKKPFVYIKAELFDDEMHPGAVAAAALIRYYAKRNEKILAGFSIEGSTLKRDNNVLERSVGRRVALTLRPCNKSCISGLLEDPAMERVFKKSEGSLPDSALLELDSIILQDKTETSDPATDLLKAVRALNKTLTAGGYNSAPSGLTGGSALQTEHVLGKQDRNRLKSKVRDWPRSRPLREWLKAELQDIPERYVDHFADVVEEIGLRKGIKPPMRISSAHAIGGHTPLSASQSGLLDGLYMDKTRKAHAYTPEHLGSWHNPLFKVKNDAGQSVLAKPSRERLTAYGKNQTAHTATAYHNLAHNFFDMGKHVPTTTHFSHPEYGAHQAMEFVVGAKTPFDATKGDEAIQNARSNGDLHKLFLMDMITGSHGDRHLGNVLVHPFGHLMHIDNDHAFEHESDEESGEYLEHAGGDNLHVDAHKWLMGLSPKKLAFEMKANNLHPAAIQHSVNALTKLQHPSNHGNTLQQMHDLLKAPPVHNIEDDE